jgi:hypothetical protein
VINHVRGPTVGSHIRDLCVSVCAWFVWVLQSIEPTNKKASRTNSEGFLFWCRRRDSNSHSFRHYPLKIACLPISPRRLCQIGRPSAEGLESVILTQNSLRFGEDARRRRIIWWGFVRCRWPWWRVRGFRRRPGWLQVRPQGWRSRARCRRRWPDGRCRSRPGPGCR